MNGMSASVHFSIKYDGPALANHQMDVRELSPALFALSDLLEEANRAAFPESSEVRVNVQGNFKGGSFGIDLIAAQTMAQQIISMLSGPETTATSNLLAILQGVGLLGSGGLLGVIKWLRGRKPTGTRIEGEKVIFEVVEVDQIDTFEADLVTERLYRSRIVRQSLYKVIKPLEREGIDLFACARNGKTESVVMKEDIPSFEKAASVADIVSDKLMEGVLLQIESAAFRDGNKWRFSDGGPAFFAEIADRGFISRIESGEERFGKGDVLIVDLRRIQSVNDNGLKLEFVIERVREHKAPLQGGLLAR